MLSFWVYTPLILKELTFRRNQLLPASILMTEAVGSSETLVNTSNITRIMNPECQRLNFT